MTDFSPAAFTVSLGFAAGQKPPVPYLPPGTMLGNYKLLGGLAAGGFGLTYVARDMALGRNVAIKECFPTGICRRNPDTGEILPHSSQLAGAYQKTMDDMRQEARFLASLNHERIVRIFEVFESHGSLFYAMPWLPGGSLREKMNDARRKGQPIAAEQALRWLRLLLEGLQYLHGKQIIHRDIKPENILFDEQDLPVLVDFGAALQRSDHTQSMTMGAFSPGYAAPEQILSPEKAGPWTDIYSLAATWYELLTGQRPEMLPADTPGEKRPRVKWPSCPRALRKSILLNLSVLPGDRCQSCDQWLDELRHSGFLPGRKSRRRLFLAAGGVLLAAGGALLAWSLLPEAEKERGKSIPASLPPRVESGAPSNATSESLQAIRADLLRREREFCHLDDWIQEMKVFCDKIQARKKYWQQEVHQWGERTLVMLRKNPGSSRNEWVNSTHEFEDRLHEESRQLNKELDALRRRNPLDKMNELLAFPVNSVEEASWKASVDQELYQEAAYWATHPTALLSEVFNVSTIIGDYTSRFTELELKQQDELFRRRKAEEAAREKARTSR